MIQSWKQRLIGGIALTTAIVLGSTMAATSVRADHARSWEGAVVGGVIGGLIGSTTGKSTTAWPRSASPRCWEPSTAVSSPPIIATRDGITARRTIDASGRASGFASSPGTCILSGTIIASGTSGFTNGPGMCILNGTSNASGTASGFMSSPGTCILNGISIARGTASGFMSSPGTCILNGTSIVMTTDGSGRAPTP